jgi:Holliday junction resolvase RusA-like endonuclease
MPRLKKYILYITPETHVRATQSDKIFFQIPEDKLLPSGLRRKKRLMKYNNYKVALFEASREAGFIMPDFGARVTFYIPVSASWSNKKKLAHHMMPHQLKPDLDNLIKAMKDSIMQEDKGVWNYSLSKRWVNDKTGYIEIIVK